jgi:phosphatidylinositol glycan class Z
MNYYGIAHVTLVFFTRTLSNSFEAFLFLTLIYLIIKNLSSILINEKTLLTPFHLLFNSSLIGLICALGIFNRPTFPIFAFVPIIYWCINLIPTFSHLSRSYLFISRILSFIIGAFLLTSSLLILFDSYYYNNGFSFIIDLKNRLIICPLNFILYNIDSTNLDKHGLHPLWLHFIANATILYGPLHLAAVLWVLARLLRIESESISFSDWIEFFEVFFI